MEIGSRWYVWGRHWKVADRQTRPNRDGRDVPMVLLLPTDVERKPTPQDWIEESRLAHIAVQSGS